jgi:hypothetical protein
MGAMQLDLSGVQSMATQWQVTHSSLHALRRLFFAGWLETSQESNQRELGS